MSPVRDFLQRFRPAGTPGKAAAAAVPADRQRDLAAELAPVLSMLDDAQAESARILREADRDARAIRAGARRRADETVADARERAQAVRADAAAAVLAEADADADAALRTARRQARAIQERAAQRMAAYVRKAVQSVRMLTGDEGEPDASDDASTRAVTGPS